MAPGSPGEVMPQEGVLAMDIRIHWRAIQSTDDPAWQWRYAVYAYLAPDGEDILYIGKAEGTTVRKRWNDDDKMAFWRELEKERGIHRHAVIVGKVFLPRECDGDPDVLTDIESLLIYVEQPWGNIQCRKSRTCRPGMVIVCDGDWPGEYNVYHDKDE